MTGPGQAAGGVDLHSHLVPGVDDGARTVEDVLEGIGRMVERGIRRIVTTPHLEGSLTRVRDRFEERMEEMDRAFGSARDAVADAFPALRFSRANEVALNHPEPDLADPRIHLGTGGAVLVEWPRLHVPPGGSRILREIVEDGRSLVLAHPERYRLGANDLATMEVWKEAGVRFQVNFGSVAGAYGAEVRRRAEAMLSRGWVDCLASDFHGRPQLRLFAEAAKARILAATPEGGTGSEAWELLTRTNPERILDGSSPLPVPGLGKAEGVWQRISSLFR